MTAASWGTLDQVGEESGEVVAVALVIVVDVVDGVVVDVAVVVCTTVVVVVVVGAKVISAVPSPSQAPATSAVVTKRSQAPPANATCSPFGRWQVVAMNWLHGTKLG